MELFGRKTKLGVAFGIVVAVLIVALFVPSVPVYSFLERSSSCPCWDCYCSNQTEWRDYAGSCITESTACHNKTVSLWDWYIPLYGDYIIFSLTFFGLCALLGVAIALTLGTNKNWRVD